MLHHSFPSFPTSLGSRKMFSAVQHTASAMRCGSTMLHGIIKSNCWPIKQLYCHTLYNTDGCTNKFAIPNPVGGQKLTRPEALEAHFSVLCQHLPAHPVSPWLWEKHSRWAAQAQDSWPPTLLHGELGHICLTFLVIRRQSLMVADDVAHLSSSPSSWPVAHTHTHTHFQSLCMAIRTCC